MELFNTLVFYLQYPFVRYALIVGMLIALCSSLLGVILVLKRYSFIGDGLSHVAFGAMAVAMVLNLMDSTILTMPVTILTAVLLLRKGNRKIKGDAIIAMISVGALASGYLIINVFSKSANISADVCTTLFGSTSILTLKMTEVWISIIMSVVVVASMILFHNRIFSATFDQDFSETAGIHPERINLFVAVITAVIIVLAMRLVGSLLITALIIFPALSAMRVVKSYKFAVILSAVISVVAALFGILTSILASTPVGATIVMVDMLFFLIFYLAGKIKGGIHP